MLPIKFEVKKVIPKSSEEICAQIADVARWNDFDGYLFLPGIAKAEYEKRTETMIGSRIRVQNTDGSAHTEEIFAWNPAKTVMIKFTDFSPPLNRLASHFVEEWQFTAEGDSTKVCRKFELFPKNSFARPFLWLISCFLKKAIAQHLDKISRS